MLMQISRTSLTRQALHLSLRLLKREWRSGELRVLALALVVAVAGITSVGFFTDRIARLLEDQAGELLAADLVVRGSRPLESDLSEQAAAAGLEQTRTVSFASVVSSNGRLQLAEVKAVAPGYPLRGQLRTAPAPYAADAPTDAIPAPGEAWLDPRLLAQLGVGVGDPVTVGATELRVGAVLAFEPDAGSVFFFNFAPRMLMNAADLPATQVIQPGSRVSYRLLVAGPRDAQQRFRDWLEPRLQAGQRLVTPRDARPQLRTALDRGGRFLTLSALVSVILAGVAIATAARRYTQRHYDTAAVLRCLGATQPLISRVFTLQLLWLGLAASLTGCLLGYLAQAGLAQFLGDLVAGQLPPPSFAPVPLGLATGLVILLGFALPPLLRLRRVPPVRVLRRDLGPAGTGNRLLYLLATTAIAALVVWHTRDPRLSGMVLGGGAVTLIALYGLALLLVRATGGLRGRVGVAWRFGLANIARRSRGSVAQVLAFGVGIMAMLLLTLVRADLLAGWRDTIPPDAPNQFLINIQPDEVEPLRAFLAGRGLGDPGLHPMVRGRLVSINGRAVTPGDYEETRAQRLVAREFNLSWTGRLAPDNRISAGSWADTERRGGLSVEEGLAETLGIGLGDTLVFRVAEQTFSAPVTSLRTVEWDSFRVNFFVLFPPGVLDGMPATWITSFHLAENDRALLGDLVQRFPSVTIIDVEAVMTQVRSIIERVSLAVEYVFLFTLLAGLVVLYAAIQSTQDERLYEGAVLRTLGARRRVLLQGLAAEFLTLGLLAGLLAALAASAVGYVLAAHVFHLAYHFNPWLWLAGALGGTLGVGIAGVAGTRAVLRQPPLRVLRGL